MMAVTKAHQIQRTFAATATVRSCASGHKATDEPHTGVVARGIQPQPLDCYRDCRQTEMLWLPRTFVGMSLIVWPIPAEDPLPDFANIGFKRPMPKLPLAASLI